MEKFDPEKSIDAQWVVDSETSIQYLMDRKTSKILAKWNTTHTHLYSYSANLSTVNEDVFVCDCGHTENELNDAGSGC